MENKEHNPNIAEETKSSIQKITSEIYSTPPSYAEKATVSQKRQEIIKPSDPAGVELNNALREELHQLDSEEGWKEVKEKAREELSTLPPDILEKLLEKFAPFSKHLPAGHSKGHFLRDAINLTGMLQDPKYGSGNIDEVELLAGIMGGMYHDIGNSIVERYHDAYRIGAHAEVGAVLFGNIAKDVMPNAPHLIKLTQYAIAAHTHYPKEREVKTKDGKIIGTTKPYTDTVDAQGNRLAMWLARQSDRRDTGNVPFIVRNAILNVKPVEDFDGTRFMQASPPDINFKTKFGLNPQEYNLPEEDKKKSIWDHCMMFATNIYNKEVPYTKEDSPYFTNNLMTPGVVDLGLFLSVIDPERAERLVSSIREKSEEHGEYLKKVLKENEAITYVEKTRILTPQDIRQSVTKFLSLCEVIEPAEDTKELAKTFQEYYFKLLTPEDQDTLARGFNLLTNFAFNRWRRLQKESIITNPHLGEKIQNQNPHIKELFSNLGSHLQTIADEELQLMQPHK